MTQPLSVQLEIAVSDLIKAQIDVSWAGAMPVEDHHKIDEHSHSCQKRVDVLLAKLIELESKR